MVRFLPIETHLFLDFLTEGWADAHPSVGGSDLAPWAIVLRTIAHGIDFSEFQRRTATLKLAN
jgi:hypothetical protein